MQSTGIIRKLDELGRIVLPSELRKNLKISEGTKLEIFTRGEEIILKKSQSSFKVCKECGKILNENDNYCSNCGKGQKGAIIWNQ